MLPGGVYRLVGWSLVAADVPRHGFIGRCGAVDLDRPDRLVTSGIYAVSRNSMYLAWALLHLGAGMATRSFWILGTWQLAAAWVHREIRAGERRPGEKVRN